MMTEDDPRLVFVPIEAASVPPAGLIQHWKDYWWVVHPTKGLVFYDKKHMSPQCNVNESIIASTVKKTYPWACYQLVPSVFRKINPRDYI